MRCVLFSIPLFSPVLVERVRTVSLRFDVVPAVVVLSVVVLEIFSVLFLPSLCSEVIAR